MISSISILKLIIHYTPYTSRLPVRIKWIWRVVLIILFLALTSVWIYDSVRIYKDPNKINGYLLTQTTEMRVLPKDTCNVKYHFVIKTMPDNRDLFISARDEDIMYDDTLVGSSRQLHIADSIIQHSCKPNNEIHWLDRIFGYVFLTLCFLLVTFGPLKNDIL